MSDLKQKILEFAKKSGADLLGFAPRERFAGTDAAHDPFAIFPEGKTVIMLGKRICRGSLRGVEEGTNFEDYGLFGANWLEDNVLAIACYDLTRVVEDEGWEAVPVFPNPPEIGPMGVSVAEGRTAPNVHPDFNFAAAAAGLIEMSYGGFALSKKYGTRQRFHMVITDAEIEPTPLLTETICDNCGNCAAACPLGAIPKPESGSAKPAKINFNLCRTCKNGARPSRFGNAAKPDRIAAACGRACLIHLEEKGIVESSFENPFRQNAPWALNADGSFAK